MSGEPNPISLGVPRGSFDPTAFLTMEELSGITPTNRTTGPAVVSLSLEEETPVVADI